jgi:hypothetical protein
MMSGTLTRQGCNGGTREITVAIDVDGCYRQRRVAPERPRALDVAEFD